MPDITMCTDTGCGQRETCYRHRATPSEFRQAYFMGVIRTVDSDGQDTCEYYMRCSPGDNLGRGVRRLTVVR